MAAHGEITPTPAAAIFADTQAEPASVYHWLDWLETEIQRCPHPFPIHRITWGNLAEKELQLKTSRRSGKVYRTSHIPAYARLPNGNKGIISRKCTADFKVRPITKWVRNAAGIKHGQKNVTVTQWIGISWDEMQRMKMMQEPWQQARWPLIEKQMARRHCIDWMRQKKLSGPTTVGLHILPVS
jgi:hypothetical protein